MMDVIGLGVAVQDCLVQLDRMPAQNVNFHVTGSSWQYGGKVPTALAALGRLGAKCAFVGAVGGTSGRLINEDFIRSGVDVSRVVVREGKDSPLVVALCDLETNGRCFIGVNWSGNSAGRITPEELDKDFITDAKYLLISGMDDASKQAAVWCKEAGIPVVIDADGYNDEIQDNLGLITHFIPSEFYYQKLYGDSTDYEKNIRELYAKKGGTGTAIVTLGNRGLAGIDDKGEFFTQPIIDIEVADTTGAGDVFHGAFIAGLLSGRDVQESCRLASAVSAIKCSRIGGRAGLPSMQVAEDFLAGKGIDYTEIDQRVEFYKQFPF